MLDFAGRTVVKNLSANAGDSGDAGSVPAGQKDPLEKEVATHSSILPGKFHRQKSLVGYSPWGRKESDSTEPTHTGTHRHTHTHYVKSRWWVNVVWQT